MGKKSLDVRPWSLLVSVERKKEVFWRFAGLGLESSDFFGEGVGYEGLAGGDSVDAA